MAIVKKQVIGHFTKSVGDIVFQPLRGQTVAKTKPASYNDAKTQEQINIRTTMEAIVKLHGWLKPIIDMGYKNIPQTQSKFNAFTSHMMKETLKHTQNLTAAEIDVFVKEATANPEKVKGNTPWLDVEFDMMSNDSNGITFDFTTKTEIESITTPKTATCIIAHIPTGKTAISKIPITGGGENITCTLNLRNVLPSDCFAVCVISTDNGKLVGNSLTKVGW